MTGPCPGFVAAAQALGGARNDGVSDLKKCGRRRARARAGVFEPPIEYAREVVAEVTPEARRVCVERKAVERTRDAVTSHFFDSGSSRRARAAST